MPRVSWLRDYSADSKKRDEKAFLFVAIAQQDERKCERVGTFGLSVGFRFAMMRPTSHP